MPHDVVQRILDACFGSAPCAAPLDGLAPFQADAVRRLSTMLDRRGGAILADSVGLGKTHVAAAIIRAETARGGSVLVTGPAQLRQHWARRLRGVRCWRWLSHTALSRGTRVPPDAALVVVDEAHAFRNPAANRYAALALACEHARVLLITATPVNNSLRDLHALLRLFAADGAFADTGVPDVGAAFEHAVRGRRTGDVRRIASVVMVRRTRTMIAHAHARLRFPMSDAVEEIRCELDPELVEHVRDTLPALSFPAHGALRDAAARELLRLGLLKRLESSSWALRASVHRHITLLDCFIRAARDGLLFDARTHVTRDVDGDAQLALDRIVLPTWPRGLDRAALSDAATRELHALRAIAAHIPPPSHDPKLARVRSLLDGELADETVLLFTEYRQTAIGLWRALAPHGGIALIHGSDARLGLARAGRRSVIERFAPLANGARFPPPAQRVRLLVATDVLAEGLDLQDARVVISFDMPWNPVRLAQRIGRIDRLGSTHARIRALAFVPDPRLDELLRLMHRIRRKLRDIRIAGGDAPALEHRRAVKSVRHQLDDVAAVRELARARLALRQTRTIQAVFWNGAGEAALCCLRTATGECVLVLVHENGDVDVDGVAAWTALADAASVDARAAPSPHPDRLRTYEKQARRRLVAHPVNTVPSPAAARAAVRIARRLGNATGPDVDAADAVLRHLRAGMRAGTELRLLRMLDAGELPPAPAPDLGKRQPLESVAVLGLVPRTCPEHSEDR